jgi:hypothetical protein
LIKLQFELVQIVECIILTDEIVQYAYARASH